MAPTSPNEATVESVTVKGWKAVLLLAAVIAQVVADRLPASVLATTLKYLGLGYVLLAIAHTARAGYRRRLPYWTRDSWRRFCRVCAIPAGVLVIALGIIAAQDYHLLVIGARGSILRFAAIAALLVLMAGGAWRLSKALDWLTDGDPAQQFTRLSDRPGRDTNISMKRT